MEFERQSKRGKVRAALDDELQRVKRTSESLKQGIQEKVTSKQDEKVSSAETSTSASNEGGPSSSIPAEVETHNLEIAERLISSGQTLQASSIPIRLAAIRIEGAKSVRPSFLGQLCKPYLDESLRSSIISQTIYADRLTHIAPGQYATIPSILHLTSSLGSDLASLDLFSDIDAKLQPSRTSLSVEDIDIVLSCREKGKYFLKTSTDVGNGEGNATIQARIRNCFGGAERADFSATMGTKTRRAFNASLSAPLFASPDHSIAISTYAQDRDLTSYASQIEGVRGVRAAMQTCPGGPRYGHHDIGFDVMHRHLSRLLPTASVGIRKQAGHSIKSALSHTYTLDNRDDPFIATRGSYTKVFQEWAGFGGDAQHYKIETEYQISRSFAQHWGFSLASKAGLLHSLNSKAPLFCDRFQLGGPVSLRMFRFNSLGPKDGYDSLGGDMYYSLGASLFAPIPARPEWPLKLHAFCNAGQLIQLDPTQSLFSDTNRRLISSDLVAKPSSSVGVGLMYRQGNLRAEVNFGVPLTARAGDGSRKGIQLGIGISFL